MSWPYLGAFGLSLVVLWSCGTARPQPVPETSPEPTDRPIEPERGPVPLGPPTPLTVPTTPVLPVVIPGADPSGPGPATSDAAQAPAVSEVLTVEAALDAFLAGEAGLAEGYFAQTFGPERAQAELEQALVTRTDASTLFGALPLFTGASRWSSWLAGRALEKGCAETARVCRDAALAARAAERRGVTLAVADAAVLAAREADTVPKIVPARAGVVGVLLPLTGPQERFGLAARDALELAIAASGERVTLIYRDTAGDADKARAAALELVHTERVAAILGPVGRKETAEVAKIARFWEVPTIVLASAVGEAGSAATTPPGGPSVAVLARGSVDPVVRARTSPTELAEATARTARTDLGLQRVAILHPDSDAGRELASAFQAELERLGGVIVRQVAYDPQAKDSDPAICALLQITACTKPTKKGPRADFDALFLPGDAATVRRWVPKLAYWGIKPKRVPGQAGRVQLLGTSGWNQPTVIDRGEHLTDNAVFADVWSPDDEAAQDLQKRFYARFQRRPSAFQAEVWDAAGLLVAAVGEVGDGASADATRVGVDVRQAILGELGKPRSKLGVTGVIAVLPDGRGGSKIVPRAHFLTIQGEEIRARLSEDEERALRSGAPTPPEGETP